MAKRQRVSDEQAWDNAKTLCRLSSRQVAMARALGMNPRKLPGLRPSPEQRWKLPVGAFIVACYQKRFGGRGLPEADEFRSRRREHPSPPDDVRGIAPAAMGQVEDLACYLLNLADDLQNWLQHGTIAPEVPAQVREELRAIVDALETGASIPQIPEIPLAPGRGPRAPRRGRERAFDDDDDELPF